MSIEPYGGLLIFIPGLLQTIYHAKISHLMQWKFVFMNFYC